MSFTFIPKNLRAPTELDSSALRSRAESAKASFDSGLDSMTGSYANPLKHWYLGKLDKEAGLTSITQEEVTNLNEKGIALRYADVKDYTPSQLKQAAFEYAEDDLRNQKVNQLYGTTNLVSGMAPYVFDPVNLFPFGRAVSFAKLGKFNPIATSVNRGQRFKAAASTYKKYAKEAFLGNAAVEPLYYMDARYTGQTYAPEDFVVNSVVGAAVGAGFFGTIAAGINFRKAGRATADIQNFEDMYSFLETGDFGGAANTLFQNSPKFRAELEKMKGVADAVQQAYQTDGMLRFDALTKAEQNLVRKAMDGYVERGVQATMSKAMSEQMLEDVKQNPDISIQEMSQTYRERYIRVYDAVMRNDFTGLNADDLDIVNRVTGESGVLERSAQEGAKPLKLAELDSNRLGALAAAQEEALGILATLKKLRVKTFEQAVAEGKMTASQRTKILKRFNKLYEKSYAKEVGLASEVINNIFGKEIKIKAAKRKSQERLGLRGYYEDGDIYLNRAEIILGNGGTPFNTIIHEAVHALKDIDPDSWQQIKSLIEESPKLADAMRDFIQNRRGYRGEKRITNELPSVALEWAITQRDFWLELQNKNRPLFVKLKQALKEMFSRLQELFKAEPLGRVFEEKELRKLLNPDITPDELARRIGEIINTSREKRLGYGKILEAVESAQQNVNRAAFSEPIAGRTVVERRLDEFSPEETIDADNQNLRGVREQAVRSQLIGLLSVDGYKADNLFDELLTPIDELQADIDPDAGEFIQFGEFKARVQEYTSTIIGEDFERYDILTDSDYTNLYDNLRNFYTNSYNKTAIAMRNNDLFRRIERAIDGKPEAEHAEIKQRVVLNYHQDAARTVVGNALKREAIVRQLAEGKTQKAKTERFRSMLDGQERAGTPLLAGLEVEMLAASQQAVIPLFDVIYRHGLQDLFMPETTVDMFKGGDIRRFEMFGKGKKERSMEFHRQLHQALLKRKLPKEWEEFAALKELFDVLQSTELFVLTKLNEAGLSTSKLTDFGGVSQKWDPSIIYDMGLDAFKARMLETMDIPATARAHGGVLFVKGRMEPFDAVKFIEQWYESLDPTQRVADDVQVFDLENNFAGRMVRLKPDTATDVLLEFSGYDNIGFLMMQQIQRLAAVAHMAKFAGTKPNELLTEVLEGIGSKGVARKSAKATVDAMTGILENPVDVSLANQGNVIKKLSNILFMSGSGIASLTDIPLAASTLQVQGISFVENNQVFLKAWQEATKRRFGNDAARMKQYWLGTGAGIDVLNNAVIKRFTSTELGGGFLDKMNKLMFRVNGLEAMTNIHQEMYVDVLTRGLAMELGSKTPSPELINNLTEFGFTKSEITRLANSVETDPNGVSRIVPNSVKAEKLQLKLRNYITKYMRQAVFMPDQGTRAQLVLGFRRGTAAGEMAHMATQYMPFMAGMSKLLHRRFVNGNFGTGNPEMIHRMSHLIAYVGGAMAFGYMATVIKDLLRGRAPIGIDGLSAFDVSRIVQQSGVLGVLEVPLDVKDWGALSALAPMPSTILGIGVDTATLDSKGLADGVGQLTGGQIIGPPQWLHGMIGESMAQTLNEMQLDILDESNP